MSFTRWLRNRKPPRQANRRPSPARLRLEQLEDRCLLTAGALDSAFGVGGIVTTNVGQPAFGGEQVNAVALQPDGKIIAVGVASTGTFKAGYNKNDTAVVRYNTDGSPDNTFSGDGKTITSFGPTTESSPNAVAVQSDGKLVVSGHTGFWSDEGDFAVIRYNSDGSLDTKFGGKGQGIVTTSFGNKSAGNATAMALQADQKIVLAGYTRTQNSSTVTFDVALVRYNLDGSLDPTFSGDGKATTHLSSNSVATAMAIYASPSPNAGKILLTAGGMLVRYLPNGNLDPTFGGGAGYVTPSGLGSLYAVTVQANDDIVLTTGTGQVARLQPNGNPDPTFGTAGIAQTLLPNWGGRISVAIQPDGKIVVGWTQNFRNDESQDKLAVARFNTNGSLDDGSAYDSTPGESFGVSGIATSTGVVVPATGGGMAIQTDGKIVVGGRAGLQATDFVLARFVGVDPPAALQAASVPERAVGQTLSRDQVEPLLTEAFARWQAAGVDVSSLHSIDIRIADLGGATLGQASGNTITLDANAAGWGWFIDSTPNSDSEFTTPGNQGEQSHIDLLTVLEHELGHLLGYEHSADGIMAEILATGARETPGAGSTATTTDFALTLLLAEELTPLVRRK